MQETRQNNFCNGLSSTERINRLLKFMENQSLTSNNTNNCSETQMPTKYFRNTRAYSKKDKMNE